MKKIFSLVVALLTLVSCSEDFLNLTPQYYPNDATFFKTQEQFTQAVNGAYSALRGVSARQGYLMGEMRSDNTHYTRYKADRGLHILYRENIADFVVDDQNQWTNEMYYACYTGISRANTILNRIEGTTFPMISKIKRSEKLNSSVLSCISNWCNATETSLCIWKK